MSSNILHITNGDAAVELFKAGNLKGEFLPWRDVMHLGPFIDANSLEKVSEIRAYYLAYLNWDSLENLLEDFNKRDLKLINANCFDEIYLWFEHDLYDQLQLIQILDQISNNPELLEKVYLIQTREYLGYHRPEQVLDLLSTATKITSQQIQTATLVYSAFKRGDIEALSTFSEITMDELPCLSQSIKRLLLELPNKVTGCNKTETYILELLDEGYSTKATLFREYCKREPILFHGDLGFFWVLEQMKMDQPALVRENEKTYSLTEDGYKVLKNQHRWERVYSSFQWLGGYSISGNSIDELKSSVNDARQK